MAASYAGESHPRPAYPSHPFTVYDDLHLTHTSYVREKLLLRAAELPFFNASPLSLGTLSDTQTTDDLMSYVRSFSEDAQEIFEHFEFEGFVQQLDSSNLLYLVVQRFAEIDMSPERQARLDDEKPIQKLDDAEREALKAACATLNPEQLFTNRDAFTKALKAALKNTGLKVGAPVQKAILNALSERDPEADICLDKKGNPEPDTSLRDNENVPLDESVFDYFEREVKPHVSDAWIDEEKRDPLDSRIGIVGFEIPVNRHFYQFTPPRLLEEESIDVWS